MLLRGRGVSVVAVFLFWGGNLYFPAAACKQAVSWADDPAADAEKESSGKC